MHKEGTRCVGARDVRERIGDLTSYRVTSSTGGQSTGSSVSDLADGKDTAEVAMGQRIGNHGGHVCWDRICSGFFRVS